MLVLSHAATLCFLALTQASDLDEAPTSGPISNLPDQPASDPLEQPVSELEHSKPADERDEPGTEPEVPRPDILSEDDAEKYQRVVEWAKKYLSPDKSRFTVYTREDYDKATSLRVVSEKFPFYLGELDAKDQCTPDSKVCTHREFDNPKESRLLNIRKITVSPIRTWGHDQYIYLHFSDGGKIWYKQPRYGRVNRERADVWIKGKSYLGIFGSNGHYVPEDKTYSDYPDQVLITRPRNLGDPKKSNAWDYVKRSNFYKHMTITTGMVITWMLLA